jgi:hypothetical protein
MSVYKELMSRLEALRHDAKDFDTIMQLLQASIQTHLQGMREHHEEDIVESKRKDYDARMQRIGELRNLTASELDGSDIDAYFDNQGSMKINLQDTTGRRHSAIAYTEKHATAERAESELISNVSGEQLTISHVKKEFWDGYVELTFTKHKILPPVQTITPYELYPEGNRIRFTLPFPPPEDVKIATITLDIAPNAPPEGTPGKPPETPEEKSKETAEGLETAAEEIKELSHRGDDSSIAWHTDKDITAVKAILEAVVAPVERMLATTPDDPIILEVGQKHGVNIKEAIAFMHTWHDALEKNTPQVLLDEKVETTIKRIKALIAIVQLHINKKAPSAP